MSNIIRFFEDKITLFVDVKKEELNLSKYKSLFNEFQEKSEFHITIIGTFGGIKIRETLDSLESSDQLVLVERIKELANKTDWSFSFLDVTYRISKEYSDVDKREAIIQLVEVPCLVNFYDEINRMLNIHLEYPLAHITLCTKGTDPEKSKRGIGVNSEIEFFELNPVCIKI